MAARRALSGAVGGTLLAVLLWAAPASSITPPLPSGDVNCDGGADSTDAALVLQYEAGLLGKLPCLGQADVSLDRVVDSVDASIILQREAGIFPQLSGRLVSQLLINGQPFISLVVEFGQPISIEVLVTNATDRAITLYYTSSQTYEFRVSTGREIAWLWSNGMSFTEAITEQTWEPDQSVSFDAIWDQRDNDGMQVPQGLYFVGGGDIGCTGLDRNVCSGGRTASVDILPPLELCAVDGLAARLLTGEGESTFALGEAITLSATITNCGSEPIIRTTNSSKLYDFVVLDEDGEVVWFWAYSRTFSTEYVDTDYPADMSVSHSEIWQQDTNTGDLIGPGIYEIRAVVPGWNQAGPGQFNMLDSQTIEIVP